MNEKLMFDIFQLLMKCEHHKELDEIIRHINKNHKILHDRLETVVQCRKMDLKVGYVLLENEGADN